MLLRKIISPLSFAVIFLLTACALADDVAISTPISAPKWRSNPKNFTKITEDRKIIASVNADKISGSDERLLRMDGGGLVRTAPQDAFVKTQQYEKLKDLSEHIVEFRLLAPNSLFVHTQAMGWHARMYMSVKAETTPMRHIHFVVDDGSFKGMAGDLGFEDYKGKTLMTFHAEYRNKILPMPAFLFEFALEIVLEKVAGKIREYLEAAQAA